MDEAERNKILIVDDEKLNLKVLVSILGPDYTVFTAKDGASAIEMAKEDQPDLILLDIIMPEMTGYDVLSVLKDDEKTKRIPVIFITGLDSKEDEEKGLTMGTADYIGKPFSAAIVKLRVRNQIQIVNQIRTIEKLSRIDQLTGIANRRSLDDRFVSEWGISIREQTPVSLLMMDVDKFKTYNDTYGHIQGDVVLRTVAGSFSQALKRSSDFAARYGGEEFSILLRNTDRDGAMIVAENIREAVERLVIPCADGSTTKVTISVGVYSLIPKVGDTIPDMIARADEALYNAKETGRNKSCYYNE